ncbi:NAD-dependent epimerase/dehydratase family protein [Flavobacterium jejuense]|uniref:NAD-dependent epimerase/dehydratase family protein n=1 Tax=Flavobacterium jejuense TaxID=1544455 RepID=A0ABX0IZ50_9FLAO|nr:NAD-dependent epimerase/dehydratase family protein [Flavobacterium jejuense]NHN27024.1 NAD-dependent epimerase/dehydratase family protein [Flavobacterium jejuense]
MVLVTGATGLVGSHLLIQLLQENETVKALYRDKKKIEAVKNVFLHKDKLNLFEKINWVQGDITNIPSLEIAFDTIREVYHCAALISFDPRDEERLRKTNIEGTANVVNCCLDSKIEKLCYVSSIAALGDAKENESIISEETEWNPEKLHSDYAISKYGAEMEVWRGQQEGLKVIIVNPGVIFGFGFPKQGSSFFFNSIKKGATFYTKGKTGIITVEDVVSIMYLLMQQNNNGEHFTLVAENVTFETILFWIADAMQLKRPFINANKTLTNFAWKIDWLLSKLSGRKRKFTKQTAIASHKKSEYSTIKIKKKTEYSFTNMKEYLYYLSSYYQ